MNTKHFNDRCDQRGINPLMVELLLMYGNETYQQDGAIRHTLTKKSFKKLKQDLDTVNTKLNKLRQLFLVECDGYFLTTGYQTSHLRR